MKSVNADQRLINVIDTLLDEYPQGIREYDLMTVLDAQFPNLFPKPDLSDKLLLFQHHFFLRHCLYLLQQQYSKQGKWMLEIDVVKICKRPFYKSTHQLPSPHDNVSAYYLDLKNLNKESHASVENMIGDFWQALAKYHHQPAAFKTLGLTGNETRAEQKQQYRKLLQQHHPDKGGQPEHFQAIQTAWQSIEGKK